LTVLRCAAFDCTSLMVSEFYPQKPCNAQSVKTPYSSNQKTYSTLKTCIIQLFSVIYLAVFKVVRVLRFSLLTEKFKQSALKGMGAAVIAGSLAFTPATAGANDDDNTQVASNNIEAGKMYSANLSDKDITYIRGAFEYAKSRGTVVTAHRPNGEVDLYDKVFFKLIGEGALNFVENTGETVTVLILPDNDNNNQTFDVRMWKGDYSRVGISEGKDGRTYMPPEFAKQIPITIEEGLERINERPLTLANN